MTCEFYPVRGVGDTGGQRNEAPPCALIGAVSLGAALNLHPACSSLLITFESRKVPPRLK